MRDFQTKTFGEATYTCQPMPALQAASLSTKIVTALGGDIAALLAGAADDEGEASSLKERAMAAVVSGLFERLQFVGHEFAVEVMLDMLKCVWVMDGDARSEKDCSAAFNSMFEKKGGLKEALLVAGWAAEVNFRQYFG